MKLFLHRLQPPSGIELLASGFMIALLLVRLFYAVGADFSAAAVELMVIGMTAACFIAFCSWSGGRHDLELLNLGVLALIPAAPLIGEGGVFRLVPGILFAVSALTIRGTPAGGRLASRFFAVGLICGVCCGAWGLDGYRVWAAALVFFALVLSLKLIHRPLLLLPTLFLVGFGVVMLPEACSRRVFFGNQWALSSAAYPAALLPAGTDGVSILWVGARNPELAEIWRELFFVDDLKVARVPEIPESTMAAVPDHSRDLVLVENFGADSAPARRRLLAEAWGKLRNPGSVMVIPRWAFRELPPGNVKFAPLLGDPDYVAVSPEILSMDPQVLEGRLENYIRIRDEHDFWSGMFGAFYPERLYNVRSVAVPEPPSGMNLWPIALVSVGYWLFRFLQCRRGVAALNFAAVENAAGGVLIWLAALTLLASFEPDWGIPVVSGLALWGLFWFQLRLGSSRGVWWLGLITVVPALAALFFSGVASATLALAAAVFFILTAGRFHFGISRGGEGMDMFAWCGAVLGAVIFIWSGAAVSTALLAGVLLRLISLSDLVRDELPRGRG